MPWAERPLPRLRHRPQQLGGKMFEPGPQLECLVELRHPPAGRIVGVKRSGHFRARRASGQPGRRHELGIGGQGKAARLVETRPRCPTDGSILALSPSRLSVWGRGRGSGSSPLPLEAGPGVRALRAEVSPLPLGEGPGVRALRVRDMAESFVTIRPNAVNRRNSVILSAAKNLASVALKTRFFAASE